ncbi:MAG: sugar phosphate isomerase/epimerase family protein [Armatimonadota bacterium]
MFNLAVITDEINQDFERALDLMVEWGVGLAELRALWGKNIADLSRQELERAKRALDERSIRVCCIASPFFKCDLTGDAGPAAGRTHQASERTLAQQMEVLNRCIEAAHLFGTGLIRTFAFWRRTEMTPEIVDRIAELYQRPLQIAKDAGVTLCLENEHDCYMSTGVETAEFLQRMSAHGMQAVWDPGNAFCAGERPYPDGYEALKPYIAHIHVKDPRKEGGRTVFVPIGEGDVDYVGQLKALAADGYSGAISIETHFAPDGNTEAGTKMALDGLRRLITGIA